jgi:hypothetical protein
MGEREIRICLTKEDLCQYAVTAEDLDYENRKGKQVIRTLFHLAKEETGFDAEQEKVYIQLYPKKNGDCEIFVTKLEQEEDSHCFFISDDDALLSLLSLLSRSRISPQLFRRSDRSCYYLFLSENQIPPFMEEYGKRIHAPDQIYLKSQCFPIVLSKGKESRNESGT